jgi:hypothetical protein
MSEYHGFYLCPLATESRLWGIFDCVTETTIECGSEAEARRIAASLYPGAIFALTTLRTIYGADAAPGVPDLVIMSVMVPDGPETHKVVAQVHGNVHGPACIPFSAAVWPDARDNMPKGN